MPTAETAAPILEVEGLKVHFPLRRGVFRRAADRVRAVDGVSFLIRRGETLGLVGESGCGKSTTGFAIMGLVKPTAGTIRVDGVDTAGIGAAAAKAVRRRMQIVFQDPYSSLNPRSRVRDILRAPLDIHAIGSPADRRERVAALMRRVGLHPEMESFFPHQFSGGQRQRIGIARALALNPELIVCDEPVSALDVSIQAQILNLLAELQAELGLSFLFISHDLRVVAHVSHRVAVMYLGRIVETGNAAAVFSAPRHPYSDLLLRSAPASHPRRRRSHGRQSQGEAPPAATAAATACLFNARCPLATDICRLEHPPLSPREDGRLVACHHR